MLAVGALLSAAPQLEVFVGVDVVTLDVNSHAARRSFEPVRARGRSVSRNVDVIGGVPPIVEAKHIHSAEYGVLHDVNHVSAQRPGVEQCQGEVPNTGAPTFRVMLRTDDSGERRHLQGTTYPRWDTDRRVFDVIVLDRVSKLRDQGSPSGCEHKALPLAGPLSFQ
ncbi:hypothetical protein MRX96_044168 [Rhipicephalus microplus]